MATVFAEEEDLEHCTENIRAPEGLLARCRRQLAQVAAEDHVPVAEEWDGFVFWNAAALLGYGMVVENLYETEDSFHVTHHGFIEYDAIYGLQFQHPLRIFVQVADIVRIEHREGVKSGAGDKRRGDARGSDGFPFGAVKLCVASPSRDQFALAETCRGHNARQDGLPVVEPVAQLLESTRLRRHGTTWEVRVVDIGAHRWVPAACHPALEVLDQ